MPDEEKKSQEQRALLKTGDGFKKIVVTKNALAPLYNDEGILTTNIFDFLLKPEVMDL